MAINKIPTGSGPGHHSHRRGRPRIRRSSHVRRRTMPANRISRALPPHPEDAAVPMKPPLLQTHQDSAQSQAGMPVHFVPPKP
jgi:hypothetical protein